MRWPFLARRRTVRAERVQAEVSAERVAADVIRPLREMRARSYLAEAVLTEMRRRTGET